MKNTKIGFSIGRYQGIPVGMVIEELQTRPESMRFTYDHYSIKDCSPTCPSYRNKDRIEILEDIYTNADINSQTKPLDPTSQIQGLTVHADKIDRKRESTSKIIFRVVENLSNYDVILILTITVALAFCMIIGYFLPVVGVVLAWSVGVWGERARMKAQADPISELRNQAVQHRREIVEMSGVPDQFKGERAGRVE